MAPGVMSLLATGTFLAEATAKVAARVARANFIFFIVEFAWTRAAISER